MKPILLPLCKRRRCLLFNFFLLDRIYWIFYFFFPSPDEKEKGKPPSAEEKYELS